MVLKEGAENGEKPLEYVFFFHGRVDEWIDRKLEPPLESPDSWAGVRGVRGVALSKSVQVRLSGFLGLCVFCGSSRLVLCRFCILLRIFLNIDVSHFCKNTVSASAGNWFLGRRFLEDSNSDLVKSSHISHAYEPSCSLHPPRKPHITVEA